MQIVKILHKAPLDECPIPRFDQWRQLDLLVMLPASQPSAENQKQHQDHTQRKPRAHAIASQLRLGTKNLILSDSWIAEARKDSKGEVAFMGCHGYAWNINRAVE
jgi:hypothetical protein